MTPNSWNQSPHPLTLFHFKTIIIIAVEAWCRKWNLSLNSSKCCAIRFTLGKCDNGTYILNNTPIKFTNLQRDLGLLIKSDLSWSDHYNYICSKAYRSLYLIRKTIPATSSTELKKRIYFTLTRSHLGYCSQIWRPHLIKDIVVFWENSTQDHQLNTC